MSTDLPEKAELLEKLSQGRFNVPRFLYLPAEDFARENFGGLEKFLSEECAGHKVIVRSCHHQEEYFKGGTFDSLETYSDLGGVKYARNRIIKAAREEKRLSILRQRKFANAPEIDPDQTGVIVMPFIEGINVMAKVVWDHWEYGYSRSRRSQFECGPYITSTPHDRALIKLSDDIQSHLGFKCEIEYVISPDGEIYVVQAKDISKVETLEYKEAELAVHLDGLRRIRKRRNYRERPIFVMDNHTFYLELIGLCENQVQTEGRAPEIRELLDKVADYEKSMEEFSLRHERFGVLGLCIIVPDELFQIANHYLDDYPEQQQEFSRVLFRNQYRIDQFLSEADTLISREAFRRNLCSHDAYGINTVRNPIWSVYWLAERHEEVVKRFREMGYMTGDYVGIEVDSSDRPTVFRF
jgi:hypothetical protein